MTFESFYATILYSEKLSTLCVHLTLPPVVSSFTTKSLNLKGHRQRISTVGYKTIFRKINTEETFLPFTVITNKDYFSRKKAQFAKFTVAVYVIYFYGRDVTHILKLVTIAILLVNIASKYCLFIS